MTMQQMRHLIFIVTLALLIAGCANDAKGLNDGEGQRVSQPVDTLYTCDAAMMIFAFQPVRALQILDSAVLVGHVSRVQADQCRARIYSYSQVPAQIDSLLGGPEGVRLDSAQVLSERLLQHDSIRADLMRQKDVLEVLSYTNRMQNDVSAWMASLRQLVDVCHQIGTSATADALLTEAEIGLALYALGQQEKGMAKLDSVITYLSSGLPHPEGVGKSTFTFSYLDALIIAIKRQIVLLGSQGKYAQTVPLARRIIDCLDDFEAHPEAYREEFSRGPSDDEHRAGYIRFYRSQALNFLAAAYASLGESNNMLQAFSQVEASTHEASSREHLSRYDALQRQLEAEHLRLNTAKANMRSVTIGVVALVLLVLAGVVFVKNRIISRKNRQLAKQISDGINYKTMFWAEKCTQVTAPVTDDINTFSDEQLFQYINDIVVRERLFLNSCFGRQTLIDRFSLSKERIGTIFSKGSEYGKMSNYVLQLRLQYATKLLVEEPQKSIEEVAVGCGFNSHRYFTGRFTQFFSMTPTEFRRAQS